jgi:hypothetical protein
MQTFNLFAPTFVLNTVYIYIFSRRDVAFAKRDFIVRDDEVHAFATRRRLMVPHDG